MFGLNLWPRHFIHPAAAAAAGAPTMEQLQSAAALHRSPTTGLPTHPYMLPGLSADKLTSAAGLPGFHHNSLFFYRPGEHMLHPSMLRLDAGSMPTTSHSGLQPDRSNLHTHGGDHDEGYLSAFVPAKRARMEQQERDERLSGRRSTDARSVGTPGTEGRCPSTGNRSGPSSPRRLHSPVASDAHSDRVARLERRSPYSPIDISNPRCPICTQKLQPGEIQQHYIMEMEKIVQVYRFPSPASVSSPDRQHADEAHPPSPRERPFAAQHQNHANSHHQSGSVSISRYETFLKIKNNRHARLNAKFKCRRKRSSDPMMSPVPSDHSRRESESEHDHPAHHPLVVEHAAHHPLPVEHPTHHPHADHPIHHPLADHHITEPAPPPPPRTTMQLPLETNRVLSTTTTAPSSTRSSPNHTASSPPEEERELEIDVTTPDPPTSTSIPVDLTLAPLHMRDNNNAPNGLKMNNMNCHVCMNSYNKPVTSVHCWHVHCEECWMKTLSNRPSCPQCNITTSPSDLRKVYI